MRHCTKPSCCLIKIKKNTWAPPLVGAPDESPPEMSETTETFWTLAKPTSGETYQAPSLAEAPDELPLELSEPLRPQGLGNSGQNGLLAHEAGIYFYKGNLAIYAQLSIDIIHDGLATIQNPTSRIIAILGGVLDRTISTSLVPVAISPLRRYFW